MAGLLEALFGADGIGGQSGAVGRLGETIGREGLVGSALGGVGKVIAPVGNLAVGGAGDWLADVVTKNPLEVLKNPTSVLNDRGEISLTRLLFPDFRRAKMKEAKDAQKFQDAQLSAQVMNTYQKGAEMLSQATMDQRGPMVDTLSQSGFPDEQINSALGQASAADQQAQIARQGVASALPGLPPELVAATNFAPEEAAKLIVSAKNAELERQRQVATDARLIGADERAAAAAERAAMEPWEKALEGLNRARALPPGPQRDLAEAAAEAAYLKVGKSSQPMTVTTVDPATGAVSNVTGPASEVSGYESATKRDVARTMVDTADTTLATIGKVRELAVKNPEAFGAAGSAMRFGQGVLGQVEAIVGLQNKARADIAAGKIEPQTAKQLLEGFQPEAYQADSLMFTLAYAQARLNNPTGVLTDNDFEKAFKQVGSSGPLTTNKSVLVTLDLIEANAKQKRQQNLLRSRKGGGTPTKLEAAVNATSGAPTGQPKKKLFGKKDTTVKPVSELSDDELQKELLRMEIRQGAGK